MSFKPFNGIVNDPKSVPTFVFESMVIAFVAIFLGALIEKTSRFLNEKFKVSKYILSILQIVFSVLVTAFIYLYVPGELAMHFQATLPGMVFPALFYGVQSSIYTPWQQLSS